MRIRKKKVKERDVAVERRQKARIAVSMECLIPKPSNFTGRDDWDHAWSDNEQLMISSRVHFKAKS
jgi:hypothetical protein